MPADTATILNAARAAAGRYRASATGSAYRADHDAIAAGLAEVERLAQERDEALAMFKEAHERQKRAEADYDREHADKGRVAAAARRLVAGPAAGAYTPWESAGGPNECAHGVAGSLACRACDLVVVMGGGA